MFVINKLPLVECACLARLKHLKAIFSSPHLTLFSIMMHPPFDALSGAACSRHYARKKMLNARIKALEESLLIAIARGDEVEADDLRREIGEVRKELALL